MKTQSVLGWSNPLPLWLQIASDYWIVATRGERFARSATSAGGPRILVISLAGIGDTLIATPLIHELRVNYPCAQIDALVMWSGSKDLLQGNPHLNTIHQKNLIKEGAARSLPFLLGLRRQRYDISINVHTQGRIHYRIIARIIGARLRLSHEYHHHTWLDRLLVNRTVPQDYSVHSIENNNRLLGSLGKKPVLASHDFELFLSRDEQDWAAEFITQNQLAARRWLGVHVGSGGTKNLRLKRWPLEHYIALFRRLSREHPDVGILLFGGPEEEEAHARIRAAAPHKLLLSPKTKDLRQAAALLKYCHAFLSVDTALMHLAAAMKVPNQIVIEAPTLNPTNVPWRNPCRVIGNPVVNGRNLDYYRYDGKPIKGTREELIRCMESVPVDGVYQAVDCALRSLTCNSPREIRPQRPMGESTKVQVNRSFRARCAARSFTPNVFASALQKAPAFRMDARRECLPGNTDSTLSVTSFPGSSKS